MHAAKSPVENVEGLIVARGLEELWSAAEALLSANAPMLLVPLRAAILSS